MAEKECNIQLSSERDEMTLKEYFSTKPYGSKAKLAKALGISRTWLGQITNGFKVPSPELSLEIERVTEGCVKRVDLRPDLFGEVK